LDFGRSDQPDLNAIIQCLQDAAISYQVLTPGDARYYFPQFRFDDDMTILYQADAGILAASNCVKAMVRLAEHDGATVLESTPILKITVLADSVEVETPDISYSASRLVITAGSWAKSVLATLGLDLPLAPTRCQEVYFDTRNPADFEADRFPTFIGHLKERYGRTTYGLASINYSGVKVALHGGQAVNHPSEINYTPDSEEVARIMQFTTHFLPDVQTWRSSRVCLYTMTPDNHFLIDKHPEYPHIVFGGGCSGHSFKFAPVIGSILTDLALRGETEYDISLFSVARFL
jgi:monomeric sarcosine oxidase